MVLVFCLGTVFFPRIFQLFLFPDDVLGFSRMLSLEILKHSLVFSLLFLQFFWWNVVEYVDDSLSFLHHKGKQETDSQSLPKSFNLKSNPSNQD